LILSSIFFSIIKIPYTYIKENNYKKMKKNLWFWGFTDSAEMWNGRFAMIGFITVIFIELVTSKGLLYLVGFMD